MDIEDAGIELLEGANQFKKKIICTELEIDKVFRTPHAKSGNL